MSAPSPDTGWRDACRRGISSSKTRRHILAMIGVLAAAPALASTPEPFSTFLQGLWPEADAQGVRRATFEAVVAGLSPDRSLPRASNAQPEFEKPLQTYYKEAVSSGRIAEGRSLAATYAEALATDERRYGVPGDICLAAWAMESDYGRIKGSRDVLRTLATLAWTRPDRPVFRDEFIAALVILDRGLVARDHLVGSWAGAMGGPQFLPSAYLKYAVATQGGAADIWATPTDVLASIAKFLHDQGWAPGEPAIEEVIVPGDFAYETLHATAPQWTASGLRRPDGRAPTGAGEAALFLPAGAAGPAFLLFPNFFVLKQYNTSDAYALSLAGLARRIAGAPPLVTPWPAHPVVLSRKDRNLIQSRLAADGLYSGPQDGKFGPKARDAIHAYQLKAGLTPADGFATPALVARLRASR